MVVRNKTLARKMTPGGANSVDSIRGAALGDRQANIGVISSLIGDLQ
jgi:hypothetical protein